MRNVFQCLWFFYNFFVVYLMYCEEIVEYIYVVVLQWFKFNGFGLMVYYNGLVVRNLECEVVFRDKSY